MLKRWLPILSFSIFAAVILVGCVWAIDEPESSLQTATIATVVLTITPEATTTRVEIEVPMTPTATPDILLPTASISTVAPTETPTAIPATRENETRICNKPPVEYDTLSVLGIREFSHVRSVDDSALTFEGWGYGPESEEALATLPQSGESGPARSRMAYIAGQLDLTSGEITSQTLQFAPLIAEPCIGGCPLEIIGQSPDEEWQLVQISDRPPNEVGLWLVSEKDILQIVDYVPYAPVWQWAEDSSLLWLQYPDTEYGIYTTVVQLTSPPTITLLNDEIEVLNATDYFLAFSPQDKIVLSTFQLNHLNHFDHSPDTMYFVDLIRNPLEVGRTRDIPDLMSMVWNEAAQSFLFIVVTEDGLEIQDENGIPYVKIPLASLELAFPPGALDSVTHLSSLIPSKNYALSLSGEHLAIGFGTVDGLWVFTCEEPQS